MEKLVLVGSEPLRLALPTPEEIEVVDQFTRRSEELEALQRLVAKWCARAINDLSAIDEARVTIFGTLNQKIEHELSNHIPTFEIWTPFSSQPRFLARAFESIPSLSCFIKRGFGINPFINEDIYSSNLQKISSFYDYFYLIFLEEIKLIRDIEIVPYLEKINKNRSLVGFNNNSSSGIYVKNPTHSFVYEDTYGKAVQCLARINSGRLFDFIERMEKIRKIANILYDENRKEIAYIEYINRDIYLQKMRKLENQTPNREKFDNFHLNWDRTEFCSENEIDLSDHGNMRYIEERIFQDILKRHLEPDKTVGDSSALADGEPDMLGSETGPPASFAEKLAAIDEFAAQHPGAPVSDKILETFPELLKIQAPERVTAPSEPPAHWPEDRIAVKGVLETPPDFIKRNYAQWLGNGLTRADIRHLDKPLSAALDNWLRRNPMPDDFDLPTLKEQNSRWIDRVEKEGFGAVVSGDNPEAILREARRLTSAKQRRAKIDTQR